MITFKQYTESFAGNENYQPLLKKASQECKQLADTLQALAPLMSTAGKKDMEEMHNTVSNYGQWLLYVMHH